MGRAIFPKRYSSKKCSIGFITWNLKCTISRSLCRATSGPPVPSGKDLVKG